MKSINFQMSLTLKHNQTATFLNSWENHCHIDDSIYWLTYCKTLEIPKHFPSLPASAWILLNSDHWLKFETKLLTNFELFSANGSQTYPQTVSPWLYQYASLTQPDPPLLSSFSDAFNDVLSFSLEKPWERFHAGFVRLNFCHSDESKRETDSNYHN